MESLLEEHFCRLDRAKEDAETKLRHLQRDKTLIEGM